jgi:hypothetical protein
VHQNWYRTNVLVLHLKLVDWHACSQLNS